MILLKYEADLLVSQRGTFFRFQMMHCGFAEEIFTAPGVIVHAQNMQQRRFACARRTHDRNKISLRNLENDVAQNVKKTGCAQLNKSARRSEGGSIAHPPCKDDYRMSV